MYPCAIGDHKVQEIHPVLEHIYDGKGLYGSAEETAPSHYLVLACGMLPVSPFQVFGILYYGQGVGGATLLPQGIEFLVPDAVPACVDPQRHLVYLDVLYGQLFFVEGEYPAAGAHDQTMEPGMSLRRKTKGKVHFMFAVKGLCGLKDWRFEGKRPGPVGRMGHHVTELIRPKPLSMKLHSTPDASKVRNKHVAINPNIGMCPVRSILVLPLPLLNRYQLGETNPEQLTKAVDVLIRSAPYDYHLNLRRLLLPAPATCEPNQKQSP
ncbi:hypothetical protein MBAV_003853 [Candidatus Magnetobacterium bavaricum]|uniref:Uncharacterized protein n=1 Tax=Candidatus Magnetobacterium bavaricum TaxID=29290 RepID=A0A0F3GPY1_9BACT|nr:hypothetical protein MBAV_003853 [Candidatus Magnetobacterium bavaricum]